MRWRPGPIPTEGVKKAFTPARTDAPDLFGMEKYAADSIPLGRWGTRRTSARW